MEPIDSSQRRGEADRDGQAAERPGPPRLWRRMLSRRRMVWLLATTSLYLLIMFPFGCGRHLANELLLHPQTQPIPVFDASARFLESPAGRLEIWQADSHPNEAPRRYVLSFVGNAGRAEYYAAPLAERWADEPTRVWALNWPGYGKSDGPATLERLSVAAEAAFEAIVEEAGDRPVYLEGDSLGTALALHVAADHPQRDRVAGLVLKNPPPLRQLILGRYGWWNLWLAAWPIASAVPRELDSVANAARVTAPVVVLSAERDQIIPPAYHRRVIEPLKGPATWVILKDADHNTPLGTSDEELVRQAIRETLVLPPPTSPRARGE